MSHEEHQKHHNFIIIVNLTKHHWHEARISYRQFVDIAFPGSPHDMQFTVSYVIPGHHEGILVNGQSTEAHNEMVCTVVKSNRS